MIFRFCFLLIVFLPAAADGGVSAMPDTALPLQVIRVDTTIVAPVVLARDTLFYLQAGTRGLSAPKRAETTSRRILEVAESYVSLDSLLLDDSGMTTDIVVQDRLILPLYDIDASLRGTTRTELARKYLLTIRTAVERYRDERSQSTLLKGVVLSVVATLVLIILLRLLSRGGRWLDRVLGARIRGISIQQMEIIKAEWLRTAFLAFQRLLRVVLVVVLVYSYLQYVLSRFVWTRPLADQLLDLTLDPLRTMALSIWDYLPNLFFLLVLIVLTRYIIKFLRFIFGEIDRGRIILPGFYADWATPTFKIVRILVIAFVLVVAFPYIPGSDSPAFKGISIFLGVLFSLGSTSAVANIIAGVILTYMRSFRAGDFVKIQDTVGLVLTHGLLVTRVRTVKNVDVTIPNATVLGTHVVNYSVEAKEGKLILPTSVTIGYDAPWRQVHALLRLAAEKTTGVLKTPEPFVLQSALNDFYVTYELNIYTDIPEQMPRIYSELHQNIQDAFNEYGVQIMSPNYIADRARPTVVPKERWYEAPANRPGMSEAGLTEEHTASMPEEPLVASAGEGPEGEGNAGSVSPPQRRGGNGRKKGK